MDHSRDAEVSLQGIDFDYKNVCSAKALDAHRIKMESEKAKAEALKEAERRQIEEDKLVLAAKFSSALEESQRIWPILKPSVCYASASCFNAIANHLQNDFICAGSYPAYVIAKEMREFLGQADVPMLRFNDIDVYFGSFTEQECDISRNDCKWTKIKDIDSEVNLIHCSNLNVTNLVENFDINAVAVCVHVSVVNNKLSTAEWHVTSEFWHLYFKTIRFGLGEPILQRALLCVYRISPSNRGYLSVLLP